MSNFPVIVVRIAKGVSEHLAMVTQSFYDSELTADDLRTESIKYFTVAQCAISVLGTVTIGESNNWSADRLRGFLVLCGFSQEQAHEVISSDDDPLCIY